MSIRFWAPEQLDLDIAGSPAAAVNTWPIGASLDGTATIRRYIGDFWFEVSNIEAGFEHQVAFGGVYWTLIIWPFDEGLPPPGYLLGSGTLANNDRFIGFGAEPGELAYTSPTGVTFWRFPGGGRSIHLDVHAQRRPIDPGNPWVPVLSWEFTHASGPEFSAVTHTRIRGNWGFLLERP